MTPSAGSVYSENGQPMQWEYTPAPLPDTGLLAENALIDMTLTCSMAAGTSIQLVGYDMSGQGLDLTTVSDNTVSSIWGTAIWGTAIWGGGTTPFQQRQVNWNQPLVFKQLSLVITGTSAYNVKISNLYMRYQILGYRLQVA